MIVDAIGSLALGQSSRNAYARYEQGGSVLTIVTGQDFVLEPA